MKIIILKPISKLGRKGEIREVKTGYARNFLLPSGMAVPATDGNLKQYSTIINQANPEVV
jgi:large subunit ribosomal protein L9